MLTLRNNAFISQRLPAVFFSLIMFLIPIASTVRASAVDVPVAPTADNIRSQEWWLQSFNIEKAWSITKGKGVKVAVIDTGIDGTHPDLQGVVSAGKNYSKYGNANGTKPVYTDTDELKDGKPAHGTIVTGILAARGHGAGNAQGYIGVAPEASVLSVSVPDGDAVDPESTTGYDSAAIRWAVDNGAKVINMSFGQGVRDSDPDLAPAIAYAEKHDVVLIAGSGNDGDNLVNFPAGYFGVVSVSGVTKDLQFDTDSSYGGPEFDNSPTEKKTPDNSNGGIALAGPFETTAGSLDMPSLAVESPHSASGPNAGETVSKDGYGLTGGTSNAAPVIAGIAALIRAKYPDMKAKDVVNRLILTASNGKDNNWQDSIGFGLPDAYAALTTKLPTVCENPLGYQGASDDAGFGIWTAIATSTKYKPKCVYTDSFLASTIKVSGQKKVHSSPVASIVSGIVFLGIVVAGISFIKKRKNAKTNAPPNDILPPQPPSPPPTATTG